MKNLCYSINMINIKSCVGKKVVYQQSNCSILGEGVVKKVVGDTVMIDNTWFESSIIVVKHILSDNINESGNNGETLIYG